VDWHPSKGVIASGGKDSKVKFWDPRVGKELHTLHAHKMTINKVRWNMNGNWLLSTSRDQLTKLFDLRTLKEIQVFRGHKREVQSCKVMSLLPMNNLVIAD
jgi:polyadenylation factor subunit 2